MSTSTYTDNGTVVTTRPAVFTEAELAGAAAVFHSGHSADSRDHGVVIYRQDGSYKIAFCDEADYVADTLVPFYAFYDSVIVIETF